MIRRLPIALLFAVSSSSFVAHAHHGVAGIGAAALEGPGAPIESASSAVLPQGRTLLYGKLDHARFKTYDPDPSAPEAKYASYWMIAVSYTHLTLPTIYSV